MKKVLNAEVISSREIAAGVYMLTVLSPEAAEMALPGQFSNIYPMSAATLLPRPISICDADQAAGIVIFVYRISGMGTAEFSRYKAGDIVRMGMPSGNGFDISDPGSSALLIGGGIGVPPILYLAKALAARGIKVKAAVGFAEEPFLIEELKVSGADVSTVIQTESDKTVLDIIKDEDINADSCFACGPLPMLFALSDYFAVKGKDIQISMEERMGCGYGACVGCVCEIRDTVTGETFMKKVCKDGPVFWGSEVVR